MTSIEKEIYEKGMEHGMERGIELGMERGMERGIERGRLDSLNDIAVRMLKDNVPFELVAKYSKLSMDNITKIAKEQGLTQ